jgi:hypothetical protein
MNELSIAESRIMIQVTEDNNRLLDKLTEAQASLENRIDDQMQAFLASLARMGDPNNAQATATIPPTPTNHQSPQTTTNTNTFTNTNPDTHPAPNTNTNPSLTTPPTATSSSGSTPNTDPFTPTQVALIDTHVTPSTTTHPSGDQSTVSDQLP